MFKFRKKNDKSMPLIRASKNISSFPTNAIVELIITSTNNPVFMMKDLRVMYQERLKELDASPEQIERECHTA